jgi:hypothetical protein
MIVNHSQDNGGCWIPWLAAGVFENVTGIRSRINIAIMLMFTARLAYAVPEYIQSEQTAAGSVDESVESTEHAFKLPEPAQVFSRLREVFREGTLDLKLRNYYFYRRRDADPNVEAWAQGGGLTYATPWWKNRLRLGSTLYTSQKLYAPADKDGSKLLEPGQKSFNVAGQAYVEARLYGDLSLRVYRQTFQFPYLNGNDSRMVPNTFESVTLYDFSGEHLVYGLGQTWRMKKRDATNFISMTEAAGIDGPDRALSTAGARYTFSNGANVGLVNHYGRDFMNIFYAEANTRSRTIGGIGLHFSAQFTRQNAVGDQLGGDFDTRTWGAKLATSYAGVIGRDQSGLLTIRGNGDGFDLDATWGIDGGVNFVSSKLNHPIYTFNEGLIEFDNQGFIPILNPGFREDHNNLWDAASLLNPGHELGQFNEFERLYGGVVLAVWSGVSDECCPGIIEFQPQDPYTGTIIAIGVGGMEWNMNDGRTNTHAGNIRGIYKNAIDYLQTK